MPDSETRHPTAIGWRDLHVRLEGPAQAEVAASFEIYERSECMLHCKVLIVDDEYVVLGSSNFDVRSLWINWEFLAVVRSRRLSAVVSEVLQREMQSSCRVTQDDWRNQPWWQRLLDRLAWSLPRWL